MGHRPVGAVTDIYRDGAYLESNPEWHDGDAAWKAGHIIAMLERHGLAPDRIVDVGCGTGGVLRELAAAGVGSSWIGYEISPQAHAIAVEGGGGGVEFRLGTRGDDPSAPHADLMMALDVFEHVDDYLGFLRSMRGGADRYVFHIPLDLSALSVLRGSPLLGNRERIGHIHYFSKGTALATLVDAGFEVIDHAYTGVGIDSDDLSLKRKLLRLPRRALFALDQDLASRALGGWSLLVLAR